MSFKDWSTPEGEPAPVASIPLDGTEIKQRAEALLKKYWGHEAFRDNQLDIITHVASGNNALVLMPTGGGSLWEFIF